MKTFIICLCLSFALPTFSQLTLEKDINIEAGSSTPGDNFTVLNGILYFTADDGTHFEDLYQYDPSTGEATLATDVRTKEGSSQIQSIAAYDGKLYFGSIADGNSTKNLYIFDPETKEVELVRDQNNQRVREPLNFHLFQDKLFISSEVSSNAMELIMYDRETGIYRSLGNVNQTSRANYQNYNSVEDRLYFSAWTGEDGSNIFYYDTNTDTIHQYTYEDPDAVYAIGNQLTHFQGWLFYSDNKVTNRGTTKAINLATGTAKTFSIFENQTQGEQPNEFFEFNNKLYFSAYSMSPKRALFAFDPTTMEVTKEFEMQADINTSPSSFAELDGILYFIVSGNTSDDPKRYLYKFDPSLTEYSEAATLSDDEEFGEIAIMLSYDGKLYCSGYRPETGRELYTYDPSIGELTLAADINTNTASAQPYGFTEYNDKLYFSANEYRVGNDLWNYDPSSGITKRLSDVGFDYDPDYLTVLDGKLYFSGNHPTEGYGLNYYDDVLNEVVPTSWRSPTCTNCMGEIIAYNNKLYMGARMDDNIGTELYAYDPVTDAGTLVVDINPDGNGHPEFPLIFNDELYFDGVNAEGSRLFRYNAATDELQVVQDKDTQEAIESPAWMTILEEQIYFSGQGESGRTELFSFDPMTEKINQRTEYDNGMVPTDLVVYEDRLFFVGKTDNSIGRELHSLDPATGEIQLELDLTPGGGGSSLFWRHVTVFNDKLYFSHETEEFGSEFWEYQNGEAQIVADIRSGGLGSKPDLFTEFNDKLYFRADDGKTGKELWSFASCLNVTVATTSQNADSLGSIDITVIGGTPPYTFLWNDGTTSEDIPEAAAGSYSVQVNDQTGCVSLIEITVQNTTATDDKALSAPSLVFPNPNNGLFHIELDKAQNGTLYISTIEGRLIFARKLTNDQKLHTMDLQGHPAGIYVLRIITEVGQESHLIHMGS